jgi:hypothetical protein
MSLPLTFNLQGTLLKGAIGDIFAPNGIPINIGLSGAMTYTPPREISCPIPLNLGMSGTLNYGIEGTLQLAIPLLYIRFDGTVDIQSVLQLSIPIVDITMSGYSSAESTLNVGIPSYSIKLTGQQEIQGTLNALLPRRQFKANAFINETGVLTVNIPMVSFAGTVAEGAEGTLNVTIPSYRITLDGHVSAEATLNIVIPMLLFHAEQLVESDDYLTMAMNTKNKALTIFNNYLFNSLCAFGGKHFGATSSGIFDLDAGTLDNGSFIEWNIKTGYLDLEQIQKKKLVEAWTSYKTDGNISFTVLQPNGEEYEYILQGIDPTETGLRLKFGRGIRTKYVALNIKNIDGSSIDLDELKLHLANSSFVKVR